MSKLGEQKMSNDIARLRGTRFVTTAESDFGKKLSEPLIKQLTGSDQLTARFLYGEFFNFTPTFKIYMATNHKPVIKGTDYGIWRRIKLIPFTTMIPSENRDKGLEEKLKAEGPGILNRLLEGLQKWRSEGLNPPQDIIDATDEYSEEMAAIGNFLKERCIQRDGLSVRVRELFKAYTDWCDDNNEHACSERFLCLRLKETGMKQFRTSEARWWQDIGLTFTE
jgi:putative DNA primase/helicase